MVFNFFFQELIVYLGMLILNYGQTRQPFDHIIDNVWENKKKIHKRVLDNE